MNQRAIFEMQREVQATKLRERHLRGYRGYESEFGDFMAVFDEMKAEIISGKRISVMDIMCGQGVAICDLYDELQKEGLAGNAKLSCLDALAPAQRYEDALRCRGIEFIQGNAMSFVSPGGFNYIISNAAFPYVGKKLETLRNWYGSLKHGGSLVSLIDWSQFILDGKKYSIPDPFDVDGIRELPSYKAPLSDKGSIFNRLRARGIDIRCNGSGITSWIRKNSVPLELEVRHAEDRKCTAENSSGEIDSFYTSAEH